MFVSIGNGLVFQEKRLQNEMILEIKVIKILF
jgi:hypothetical protein